MGDGRTNGSTLLSSSYIKKSFACFRLAYQAPGNILLSHSKPTTKQQYFSPVTNHHKQPANSQTNRSSSNLKLK
jgi:hypothetical protein